MLHSNVAEESLLVKVIVAPVLATEPVGPPVKVVSGAVTSTVHARVAGDGSRVPVMLRART